MPGAEERHEDSPRGFRAVDAALVLLIILVAVIPYLDIEAAFRSDDVLLLAQGAENTPLGGVLRSFMRPFGDTRTIEFYRPLFHADFCVTAHLFGDDPTLHKALNLALQALACVLSFLFVRQLAGRRAAFFAAVLMALSPWGANNVGWLAGRCTIVATVSMLLVGLLHGRARARGRVFSPAALLVAAFGLFYRETAIFAPAFALAIELAQGEKPLRSALRGLIYAAPLPLYLIAKKLVIGTVVGGYTGLTELRGGAAEALSFSPEIFGRALYRLVGCAPEPAGAPLDGLSWVLLGLLVGAVLIGMARSSGRRSVMAVLLAFVLIHAALLCTGMADATVQVGTAQRWHSVWWGITALAGAGLSFLPGRSLALALLLVTAALQTHRLRSHLDDYDSSAILSNQLRAAVSEAVEEKVFIYNVVPYVGAAPFFEIGAGQLGHPPFGRARKEAYPIGPNNAYGPDARETQTPVAGYLQEGGELLSVLWVDYESGRVFDFPKDDLAGLVRAAESVPRLALEKPAVTDGSATGEQLLACSVEGINRLEIHLVCPLAEVRVTRRRGDAGFPTDAVTFQEELAPLLEIASHKIRGARAQVWLWVAAYAEAAGPSMPTRLSRFVSFDVHPQRQ